MFGRKKELNGLIFDAPNGKTIGLNSRTVNRNVIAVVLQTTELGSGARVSSSTP